MKKDYTHLGILVDRSGSMSVIQKDAEGGLKSFLADQRNQPGELTIDLYDFDTEYRKVPDIDNWHLLPRGATALLDAMGRAITDVGETLSAKPESERPDRVVFVIVTDGEENSSREWTRPQVFDLVTQQQNAYKWQFVFLAANQDAITEATKLGVENAMNYNQTHEGNAAMWDQLGTSVVNYRSATTTSTVLPEHAEDGGWK